jgi:hypothetical protein
MRGSEFRAIYKKELTYLTLEAQSHKLSNHRLPPLYPHNMERQYSREKDDALHHEVTAEYHEYPGFFGNIRGQLEAWHGSRGDRSVLASIVPLPRHNPHMPKNPFLVLRGMSAMGWASFFVGWLCWMCDG